MAEEDEDAVKLALLAHDLRTPLAAMRLTADLIGNGPLNDAQGEQLSILKRSIDALAEITGELVTPPGSRSRTTAITGSVAEAVADICELFQAAANAKGLALEVRIDQDANDLVSGSPTSLRRIVTSLLDNAIKYTASGSVTVDVKPGPPQSVDSDHLTPVAFARLVVRDSGPGIEPDEAARLFRPFVRGRHGRETGPGSGLGLWGIAQLVQEMKGSMHLEQPESGGSRFVVDIPVMNGATTGPIRTDAPSSEATEQSELKALHVLVVDDNETNCRLLVALLESFGVEADVAHSGPQAIAMVKTTSYDAVLLDLHMPEMSGLETAKRLQSLTTDAEVPLIAVTAAVETAEDAGMREAGFRDLLTKPLSPTALYQSLKECTL